MDIKRQERAPIYEALEEFKKKRVVPFDVPGHKRGRGNPELVHLLGEKCVGLDVNSMKPLDNLCHPVSVIREAEELAADAFGAANAFLMVGGTTSAVQDHCSGRTKGSCSYPVCWRFIPSTSSSPKPVANTVTLTRLPNSGSMASPSSAYRMPSRRRAGQGWNPIRR